MNVTITFKIKIINGYCICALNDLTCSSLFYFTHIPTGDTHITRGTVHKMGYPKHGDTQITVTGLYTRGNKWESGAYM